MSEPLAYQTILLAILAGYALGAIPFGLLLTRLAGLGDIRKIGSGNIGATNVLRTGNKALALLTLLLDGGKGAAAALLAETYLPGLGLYAGGAAFVGHIYPVWLKFKGGKGVATFLGTLLALGWPVGLAACLTWLITALLFRISSLSALVAAALSPLYSYYIDNIGLAILSGILCSLIFIRHKDNIKRLLDGTEPRIGKKG
ncbi:glycerol-3-phosphate 1-O-acyltransferase PlsY [Luteithermobacter gelatinilyticus]|uniref:glycerol-3-phosphate 1-O-acyltransferase PlsY n=1 Tax=Luteithermobacter gelatinilyticus TaxID=2582913 RepID=UPI001106ACDF|nr:glycerol-3-phosphate 1-O-acyltransferase PlsY [Luteithermobacter gelatinilyticus]